MTDWITEEGSRDLPDEYEGCPKCDSGDITEIGRDTVMHVDGMYRWHWMQCETCKHEWTESEPWL